MHRHHPPHEKYNMVIHQNKGYGESSNRYHHHSRFSVTWGEEDKYDASSSPITHHTRNTSPKGKKKEGSTN